MPDLPPYADRFDFGRLFADAGRVLTRAGPLIAAGALVLGAVPITLSSEPWYVGIPASPEAYQRIYITVTLAKLAVALVAYSATTAFVSSAALAALTGESWRHMFTPLRLTAGFLTTLCLETLISWPSFVTPFADTTRDIPLAWLLSLGGPAGVVLMLTFVGLAPSAAIAEQRFLVGALVRSFRLLRGLRGRMLGLSVAYVLTQMAAEYVTAVVLWNAGVSYQGPGPGRAFIALSAVLVGVLGNAVYVSFYLQARRLTDGPSAPELHDVFG